MYKLIFRDFRKSQIETSKVMLYSSNLHIDIIYIILYNKANKSKEADKMTMVNFVNYELIYRSAVLSALL